MSLAKIELRDLFTQQTLFQGLITSKRARTSSAVTSRTRAYTSLPAPASAPTGAGPGAEGAEGAAAAQQEQYFSALIVWKPFDMPGVDLRVEAQAEPATIVFNKDWTAQLGTFQPPRFSVCVSGALFPTLHVFIACCLTEFSPVAFLAAHKRYQDMVLASTAHVFTAPAKQMSDALARQESFNVLLDVNIAVRAQRLNISLFSHALTSFFNHRDPRLFCRARAPAATRR